MSANYLMAAAASRRTGRGVRWSPPRSSPSPCAFQLSRPGHLSGFTQYDDGVYFGNAVRLVHGAIAYRDFATVQPPGPCCCNIPGQPGGTILGYDTLPGLAYYCLPDGIPAHQGDVGGPA